MLASSFIHANPSDGWVILPNGDGIPRDDLRHTTGQVMDRNDFRLLMPTSERSASC